MEIAGAVVGETMKSGIAHFERELGYLFHFRRNFHSLRSKTDQLMAAQADVQRLKDVALNNDELIRATVHAWLTRTDTVINEAADLIAEAEPINRWIKGWCSCSRFTLGRKAKKKILTLNEILAERSTFGDVVSDPKPVQSLALVTAGDFNAFQSRKSTTERVVKALSNDAVNLVGVYGMPGVGKTVLIEALSKQVKEKKLFDEVVLVIISQNPDLKRVQGNVANQLGLKLEETDGDIVRARRLSERLQREAKILLVLDDLWERLELAELGIPLRKNNNKGCKVIFTTRSRIICGKMETDENIEVVVLSEQDSWSLFQQKAGDAVESADIQPIARNVANECKGLPLALVTLGRALRDKNAVVWGDALVKLKKSVYEEDLSPVTFSISLSFNFLESETTKLCFLFCCSFPEDYIINIKLLIMYVMGEKLLENVDSLVEARGRLHGILEKLASSSLLLHGQRDDEYKMHDVVRDVALSIASKEGFGFMVKAGKNLTEWPSMELDKCIKRLSLIDTKIRCNLPYQIESPLILSLSMNNFRILEEFPPDFFVLMPNLLVLDLSKTGIKALPPSLACLVNLRTLLLRGCRHFDNVSPIEKLERLEILDLSRSEIEKLPAEMRRLTNLKLLNLSNIRTLKTIAPKVISSMPKLEELYVSFDFKGWEIEGMSGDGVNASFFEVESLAHLTCLQIHVTNGFEYFSNYIPGRWENLAGYDIVVTQDPHSSMIHRIFEINADIGRPIDGIAKFNGPIGRSVYLQFQYVSVLTYGFLQLLRKLDFLFYSGCRGLESSTQLDPNRLDDNLKALQVDGCHEIKYLINNIVAEKALSNLEKLVLRRMDNLVGMCNGTLPRGFLNKLRVMVMIECEKITTLIPCDFWPKLRNLETIVVGCCGEMHQLFQVKWEVKPEEKIVSPYHTIHPSPSSSSANNGSKISKLPPCLMLPNLKFLVIQACPKLKYILPMSVVGGLVQLERIQVRYCDNVEMIIANENDDEDDGDRDRDNNGILPRLRELVLSDLPKLSSFCPSGIVLNWPSLETLEVLKCESLKNFPWGITHQSLARMNWVDVDDISLDRIEDPSIKQLVLSRSPPPR